MQRQWYRAVLTGNVRAISGQKQAGLLNIIMQLRKVRPANQPVHAPEPP